MEAVVTICTTWRGLLPPRGHMNLNAKRKPQQLSDLIAVAEALLKSNRLTAWETKFISSVLDQAKTRYDFRLSEKQQAIFKDLLRKGQVSDVG